jgi:hypothetical protein
MIISRWAGAGGEKFETNSPPLSTGLTSILSLDFQGEGVTQNGHYLTQGGY